MGDMSLARRLADRITSMRYGDLPQAALYWSKVAVLDTIGVALAGSRESAPRLVEEALECGERTGPSLILGSRHRTSALDAALVNATAAHVLDFDNTANRMGGHVSAVMVPALIAAGEAVDASGRDLLTAYVVGFETGARIGPAVNYYHSEKGWHPTVTIGVFAVTAACARLLNLSVAQTEIALALSTSLAAGIKANFGTMTKSLHAGQCARSGLLAALLARKGFTANLDAFEHKQGYFNVFNGAGRYDAAHILDRWGDPLDIVTPGASYKQYPCCYSTHAAVEAALNLVHGHGPFDPRQIARVVTATHPRRLAHTDRPEPKSALDAKFSVQYCVAVALLHGRVVLEDFEDDACRDPVIRDLLARVRALPYTGDSVTPDNPFDAEVTVTLTDGRTFSAVVGQPLGRTSHAPIAFEQIRAKFENCAGRVLSPSVVADAFEKIQTLEERSSLRDVTRVLDAGIHE